MTIEYRCGKCGALLDTTNTDPLHDEIERLRAALQKIIDLKGLTAVKTAREALNGTAQSSQASDPSLA